MATRTTIVHDRCSCGRVLLQLREAELGRCSSCWFKSLRPETRNAMNRVIASAFNGASATEQEHAVTNAFAHLQKEAIINKNGPESHAQEKAQSLCTAEAGGEQDQTN